MKDTALNTAPPNDPASLAANANQLIERALEHYHAGRLPDAITDYHEALAIAPGNAQIHANLGVALQGLGRHDEAVACYRKAIALKPYFAEAYAYLGAALKGLGRLDEAVANFEKAIAINPDYGDAMNNLGVAHLDLGELAEAIVHFKKATAIDPNLLSANFNYLHTLLYRPGIGNAELFATYRKTVANRPSAPQASQASQARQASQAPAHQTPPLAQGEKLRIGYLSSDFRDHPLGENVAPLLRHHDHQQFEIFCYSNVAVADAVTDTFEGFADHWRPIQGLTDEAIAEKIQDDAIHIMVYLGGHFDDNHPSVATYRPAPVQVGIFGGTTSALDEMDFWLTDPVLHPLGEPSAASEQFTEELVRVPSLFTYFEPKDAPDVSPLPADKNGFVTFASFNKPSKLNDAVLDLWSEILLAVPNARLLLKSKNYFNSPLISDRLMGRFSANGVNQDRITLLGTMDSFQGHLTHYGKADITLDTFPFSGATTTFQSLWMGVPVISLMGERFIGRMGGSLSVHAGLGDLVAETPEDYVQKATALAADLPRLKDLRGTLRQRITASALCDGASFAKNVEKAFLEMWERKS